GGGGGGGGTQQAVHEVGTTIIDNGEAQELF
ncbi:hypothetical protein Q604_UNBC04011G0001, partial [human gut metagenome]